MKEYSKRVPNKNIRKFNGKPLYYWILSTLLKCPSIDLIYINTDNKIIMEDLKNLKKVQIVERPPEIRGDISMNDILMHDVQNVDADIYLQTHATNPLLTVETIEKAIKTFIDNNYDSLFSVTPLQMRLWNQHIKPLNHKKDDIPCTQKLSPVFIENSSIYIFTKKSFLENNHRIGKNPIMFEISREEAWDIDEMIDFKIAEFLHKNQYKWHVLITVRPIQDEINKYLEKFMEERIKIDVIVPTQGLSEGELMGIISKYDGVLAGDDEFTRKVFKRAKKLKVVSKWGTGIDNIDLKAAKEFNVKIFNSAGNLKYSVAEFTIGLMICLARGIPELDKNMKGGRWKKRKGSLLRNKTLGVIGIGRIGKEILTRAKAFGMNLIGYDVVKVDLEGVEMTTLEDLLQRADFVSINCPLTSTTKKMIGKKQLGLMKKSAFLINTARGAIIDEKALTHALMTNRIRGAALDVFEEEPLPEDSPLRRLNNCILTPHNAFWAGETVREINDVAIENLIRGLKEK